MKKLSVISALTLLSLCSALTAHAEAAPLPSDDFEIISSFADNNWSKEAPAPEKDSVYITDTIDFYHEYYESDHNYYGPVYDFPACYGKGTVVRLKNKEMEEALRKWTTENKWRPRDYPVDDFGVISPREGMFVFYDANGTEEDRYTVVYPELILRTGYEDVEKGNQPWVIFSQLNEYLDKLDEQLAAALPAGDINADNDTNVTDLNILAAQVKSVRPLTEHENAMINMTDRADINRDGDINVTDLALLAANVKGIRPL
ncbi:dockerin type I repeat-containing protein [Ruminococcus sp.]|uniref:dockerin type I repeat-containing protein n=1 Tax=Ruminococcus sp. TaxID=41978 RepID=UPI0025F90F12|nr:dockerin type I repeat-containing protein [Ruminococcus sp.]MBQ8965749.1 dockerin type I repeat-containing protein [Ruminococcus sp.]